MAHTHHSVGQPFAVLVGEPLPAAFLEPTVELLQVVLCQLVQRDVADLRNDMQADAALVGLLRSWADLRLGVILINVRAEYLLYKDDFPTDTDRIWACAKTQSIRDELMEEVLEAHGYQIKDITDTMPIEIDSEGRQYQCPAVALISPSGSIRKFPDDEFFDFLRQLDDEIEMHAAFQFRMLFDKAKNLYKWKV